jgi:integrase
MTSATMPTMRLAGDARKALARKVNLTARTIAAFSLPPGRSEAALYDNKVPGLQWRIREPGIGGFFFVKRINGRLVRAKIGGGELPVETARRLALAMAGDAAQGVDPQTRRREDRAAGVVLRDLLTNFIDNHAKKFKRTWQHDQAQIDRYLTGWLDRRVADISQDSIRALHTKVGEEHGKFAANRLLALLSTAFNRAGELWTGPNPCRHVQRFKEHSRERFLTHDEIRPFFAALNAEPNTEGIPDAIRFALLSGARRSNVLGARWADIDLTGRTWNIPATASKSGKPILIPLSPAAVALLERRKKISGKTEFVFPSYGATGHLIDFKTSWHRIRERAGLPDLRLHDLRRSLGSWMAIGGSSLPVVGAALGHKSTASTAVYARLSLDPVRQGIDAATAAILAAGKAKPTHRARARRNAQTRQPKDR